MNSILVGGEDKPLGHLAAMEIACPCKEIGRDLKIYVHFTTHCYTDHYDANKHSEDEIVCSDGDGRHRVFCPIRYALSPKLPELIAVIPKYRVHQTASRRNYVYIVPLQVDGQVYEIYFMLQRAASEDKADLRLTVESAYPVVTPTPRPKRPNDIRFAVLAFKVLRNEEIKFAAR